MIKLFFTIFLINNHLSECQFNIQLDNKYKQLRKERIDVQTYVISRIILSIRENVLYVLKDCSWGMFLIEYTI